MARSPSRSVRRCLFPVDTVTEQATVDNFANLLQESLASDREEKIRKWNLDYVNDVALPGPWQWWRKNDANEWIFMNTETTLDSEGEKKPEETCVPMQLENESTPKSNREEEPVPPLRKRRTEDSFAGDNENGVRRRLSFD